MSMLPVVQQMSKLFLMMLVGYVANRAGILGRDAQKWLSKLLVNIISPALILSSVTTSARLEDNHMLLVILAASFIYYLLAMPVIARVCSLAAPKSHQAEFEVMLIYSNMIFMGLPVAIATLGQDSVLYFSLMVPAHNLSFFTYAYMRLSATGGGSKKLPLLKMINPGTVSSVLGVVLYLCNISIPSLVLDPITSIGNTTTPLAMMIIGASLANSRVKEMLTEKSMILFTLLRLILLPVLAWVFCRFFISDRMLAGVIILVTGMPVAANNVMLCNDLNRDGDYIAKGVFFSTLLSVVTIPLLSLLV